MQAVQFGAVHPVEIYLKEGKATRKLGTLAQDDPGAAVVSSNGVNDTFQSHLKDALQWERLLHQNDWGMPANQSFPVEEQFGLRFFEDADFRALPMAEFMEIGNTPVLATGQDAIIPMLNRTYTKYCKRRGITSSTALQHKPGLLSQGPAMDCIERDKPVEVLIEKNRFTAGRQPYRFVSFIA